jgi:hypothetical protein
MPLLELLLQIERELWRGNARLYRHHLHDDAVLVFAETGVMDKASALNAIEQGDGDGGAQQWKGVIFSEARAVEFTDDAAMLTYRADARNAQDGSPYSALSSSLYTKRDGQWKLAFHQQTPLNGQGSAAPVETRSASRRPAAALGALAVGALATGAAAVGALAVGRLAIGVLGVKRGHIDALEIERLDVGRLRVEDAGPA